MKKLLNKIFYLLATGALAVVLPSCNDFLNKMPDNRATVDTQDKIQKMLVSAYPTTSYCVIAELSSDNTDDIEGVNNPNYTRFYSELFNWIPSTQTDYFGEAPNFFWASCYKAISSANQALQAIDQSPDTANLSAEKAEALLCRAYSHFVLVNMFCQHYDKKFAGTDLGIPYMEKSETTLNPKYERGTVADVYQKIDRDIQAALPDISDAYYKAPKYHFNMQAAYAFVARFYLYYENFDKAIEYATKALGAIPQNTMRDNDALHAIPMNPYNNVQLAYVNASEKANFLLMSYYSGLGLTYGVSGICARFNHPTILAKTESVALPNPPWNGTYKVGPVVFNSSNINKILLPHFPNAFEYLDPVARIGYYHTVHAVFTAEETLLVRAEAYVLKNDFTNALNDMNIWVKSATNSTMDLRLDSINAWVTQFNYYKPDAPTPRKELHPGFSVQKGTQENMIQLLLFMRRYETLHTGLRWFDLKRYGIVVYRRLIKSGNVSLVYDNPLVVRDPRRAIQIPSQVIGAGLEGNPIEPTTQSDVYDPNNVVEAVQ